MPLLNLGIVAHVDAGKTSLTERLLYEAGVLDAPGSVDAGTARTDSMDLERRRGITIRAAVTSFAVDDLAVTILDTPGHPDFITEVERSLAVLDAAVLVLSGVEGVQPQSVVIWRALQRVGVPTVLFVNKVDRAGSDAGRVVDQVRVRLTDHVVPLADVDGEGTRAARVHGIPLTDERVVQVVADVDDRVLGRWARGEPARSDEVLRALRSGVRTGSLTPLVCGSAITGTGLAELRRVLTGLLPCAAQRRGSAAATIFAVDRDEKGRRRAWIRLWSGRIRVRDRIAVAGRRPERVTEVAVSTPRGLQTSEAVAAGEVAVVRGLSGARVGDTVGEPPRRRLHRFAPATMHALVEPVDPARRSALFTALTELADEDPLIDLRIDEVDGEAAVSLHGEVQREVIAALLEERYALHARFLPTSSLCIERVSGVGEAVERIRADGNPYLATIGLRVEPAPVGSGVEFSPGIERGNLPPAFVSATEEGVRSALRQGLRGWPVADCVVTMTESGYYPRQSHAHQKFSKAMSSVGADFRSLAPVVVMAALARGGTRVCQPVDRFEVELPEDALGAVTSLLGRLGGAVMESAAAPGVLRLVGHLPSEQVRDLARLLPDLTGGEGMLITRFDHYAPTTADGLSPVRRRTGPDPRDRVAWFRDVPR
ncbi:MAG TPA: translation factor GTPase family protein [Dermatophilaceae bacterium]|nr:translation factor GTPase family protein [Dermatophilaceae bacterium]